jgi:small subunit ribosomal protein S17
MPNNRKRLIGRVESDKMDKTVSVLIERRTPHPIYKKIVQKSRKVLAHDESNEVPAGAVVRIVESKPLSKRKRWVVEEVLSRPGEDVVNVLQDEGIMSVDTLAEAEAAAAEVEATAEAETAEAEAVAEVAEVAEVATDEAEAVEDAPAEAVAEVEPAVEDAAEVEPVAEDAAAETAEDTGDDAAADAGDTDTDEEPES